MLNVGKIENGIVLDHIEAGKAMLIYHYLHLDREDYQVAIIKNAVSTKTGKKDILKIVVAERHNNTHHIGIGYIRGYGLMRGAVATDHGRLLGNNTGVQLTIGRQMNINFKKKKPAY